MPAQKNGPTANATWLREQRSKSGQPENFREVHRAGFAERKTWTLHVSQKIFGHCDA
jgi:hypothetical protein